MGYQQRLPLVGERDGTVARRARRDTDWRLDERTRAAGRRGLAAARAALARSERPRPDHADAA